MKCPACKGPLLERNDAGMALDVCYGGCGGIWFDAAELARVSAHSATSLHTIFQITRSNVKLTEPRICPRCSDQVLERKWFSDLRQVEIDQCLECGGIWLDDGEFTRIYEEIKGAKVTPPGWALAMSEAAAFVQEKRDGKSATP